MNNLTRINYQMAVYVKRAAPDQSCTYVWNKSSKGWSAEKKESKMFRNTGKKIIDIKKWTLFQVECELSTLFVMNYSLFVITESSAPRAPRVHIQKRVFEFARVCIQPEYLYRYISVEHQL